MRFIGKVYWNGQLDLFILPQVTFFHFPFFFFYPRHFFLFILFLYILFSFVKSYCCLLQMCVCVCAKSLIFHLISVEFFWNIYRENERQDCPTQSHTPKTEMQYKSNERYWPGFCASRPNLHGADIIVFTDYKFHFLSTFIIYIYIYFFPYILKTFLPIQSQGLWFFFVIFSIIFPIFFS